MNSTIRIKVIGVTVAILNKQHGGTTLIKTVDNFKRLLPKSGNFLVCPISLESLLAVIQIGAKGDTAKEISLGLKLPITTERLLETYLRLYPMEKIDDHYHWRTFRQLFLNSNFELNPNYKDDTVKYFHVNINNMNLLPAQPAIEQINNWFKESTENSVKNDLINPKALTNETRAVFGNIVNLQGLWVSGFTRNPTAKRKFFIDAYHYVEVEMIDIISKFNYYENDRIRAQFLELTYENSDSSLNVVLPYDINGLVHIETVIHDVIQQQSYRQEVHVRVPKMELKTVIPFNSILRQLGIVRAFQNNADLSSISHKNEDKLRIDGVMQETIIKIEETGKSDIPINLIQQNTPVAENLTFFVNHPCIIFLKDKNKGIFFMGRFLQPEGKILPGSYAEESKQV